MPLIVNIDGKLLEPDEAKVSVVDRGFLYGDSVYEVVRTYQKKIFAFDLHLERLEHSARRVFIELPDKDWLREQVNKTISACNASDFYCRIIVTRGSGPINLDPTIAGKPLVVIIAKEYTPFPESMYQKGIKVTISSIRRTAPSSLDPAIKSGNYLNSVLALGEAKKAGFDDALMLGATGRVTEATTSNVFALIDGQLCTPTLSTGILEGVTRRFVLTIASEFKVVTNECDIYPQDLANAEEVMLTSTLKGVMPIVQVGQDLIGDGKPGPLAQKLRKALHSYALKSTSE